MASIIKGVNTFLSPLKSPSFNFAPSPINNKGRFLSATAIKPILKRPGFESRCCKTLKHSTNAALTEKQSYHYKAVKCLFSSPQPSGPREQLVKRCYLDTNEISRQASPPSFDTPLRKSIQTTDFYENTSKRFIIGRGSYGLVVEGRYKSKAVAVKIMSQCQEKNEVLKSELNALKLNHPNLIQVSQVVLEPATNMGFVFMELYLSINLESFLQNQTVHLVDKVSYMKQIANALQYCHIKDILHLDVKPKNIIVNTEEKICKLCDFGSSVDRFDSGRSKNPRKGTLKYLAPELLQGNDPTEKSDVYSFGITMWQTIHQEVPYKMEDWQQVVYKVVKQNYRPESCKSVDTSVQHIYEACWHAVPLLRPSMFHVERMLEAIQLGDIR